jgi:hypothetical protein
MTAEFFTSRPVSLECQEGTAISNKPAVHRFSPWSHCNKQFDRADSRAGNVLGLYSGGARFEYQPGLRLC